ncbi:protein PIN-LIKES 3 [Tanacetum coccineum]
MNKIFNAIKEKASQCVVVWNGAELFQVNEVACIFNMNYNGMQVGLPEDWVHQSMRLQTWKKVYFFKINPVPGREFWEKSQVPSRLIPILISPLSCTPGHNKRSCKGTSVAGSGSASGAATQLVMASATQPARAKQPQRQPPRAVYKLKNLFKACLDSFGKHAVHCKELPGFKYRHDMVGGKHACVNLTGVSPLVGLSSQGFTAGHAALKAASCKVTKHEKTCIEIQHVFIPFAFDTFGFFAPEAMRSMGFLDLFSAASMPVLKVLIVTALGSYLALDSIDILGQSTRKQINNIVFFVFNPALVGSNLASTITYESMMSMWFMPVNIFLTYIIGSALGWVLLIIAKPPRHLKGLILGSCSAGNMGSMLMIILPAVCKETASPFGDPNVCHEYSMAYASLSLATGAVYLWLYVYNLVRISSSHSQDSSSNEKGILQEDLTQSLLPSPTSSTNIKGKVALHVMKQNLGKILRHINLKAVFAPSTIGAIVGFTIGTVSPLRRLLIGTTAPLRVIQDSAALVGDASIPIVTLIVGGNLLRGLKGSGISMPLVFGIVAVKYVFLPLFGILIVKAALYLGLVHADPLYVFVLLLQFAVPPAMNTGTIVQLFGVGESECSVIMLWTYGLASVALTLWSTFFMWLVA